MAKSLKVAFDCYTLCLESCVLKCSERLLKTDKNVISRKSVDLGQGTDKIIYH